jgi:hypothetical protein
MSAQGQLDMRQIKLINEQTIAGFPQRISTRVYIPEWPVFALPHVPETVVRHVAVALLSLEPDDPAAKAAGLYGYTIPADYLPVEELAERCVCPPMTTCQPLRWPTHGSGGGWRLWRGWSIGHHTGPAG